MNWNDLLEIVEHEGYDMPYTPELDIDRDEAEKRPCSKCGGERRFTARAKRNLPPLPPFGGSAKLTLQWRAFAICKACNHAEEF